MNVRICACAVVCTTCDQSMCSTMILCCMIAQLRFVCFKFDTTQPNMAEEGSNVFDAIRRLGVAGKPLDKNEEREVGRLAEVGKIVLEEAAYDLIRTAHKRPVLFDDCGDGTPLKLKSAFQVAFAEHHKHARSGYTGEELFCQGGFVRSLNQKGEPVVRCLLRDPRPMSGKGAVHAFNALVEFFPTLDQVEHDGFHIHHYSWDGALHSACTTLARKYHTVVLRKLVDRSPKHIGVLKVLKSWLLTTGCGLHDIHNGFIWGISKLLQSDSTLIDDMYIVLESLRNGYKHLQSHLSTFLLGHVVFKDCGWGRDDLQSFWTALDVEAELCNMLSDRGVLWLDGSLHVSCAFRDDPELLNWLYNAIMTVFRLKKFSTSRWITVGCCCRTLSAALALGLKRLHQMCIDDDKVGNHYISGFLKLTPEMTRFSVVAAISSRPTEALGLAVLEDDRAVRQIESYESILADEMVWMTNLGEPVWRLLELASFPGASAATIKTDCMDCAHTAIAYTYRTLLGKVRTLPWSLAIGDVFPILMPLPRAQRFWNTRWRRQLSNF